MSLLFSILSAAHARGTHHYLALDALRRLRGPDAERWQRLFLVHAELYLAGSKAPDTEFKDFTNHVLHPRDGYWGGAPDKARIWYHDLVEALEAHNWETAVYCAGVLSHYCTDPIQPLHTAQSEAENNIHRAVEWSIAKSYPRLVALGAETQGDLTIPLSSDPNWLAILICQGADRANVHYEKLIAHYDVTRGVVDPPAGLDPIAQRLVGELLIYAAESFAVVLGKAFAEASVTPPDVSLAAATVVAALKVPMKFVLNRLADAGDRREVERMYDELRATGRVQQTLPEEARQVRDGYARDVLAKRVPLDVSNVFPFTPRPESVQRIERARIEAARAAGNPAASGAVVALEPRPAPPRPVVDAIADSAPPAEIVPVAAAEVPPTSTDTAARVHLTPAHAVVDGPSIGPKMAERLAPHGIKTVADLFAADPETLAAALDQKYVKAATIRDWQDQARLVCAVPGLRGTHAQLLVGAGYRSAAAVAGAETGPLCAAVLRFATSPDGQRVLRDGAAPDAAKIASWLENARRAHAA